MIWVWIQSLVVLTLVFSGGLWFGGALVTWTTPRRAIHSAPHRVELSEDVVAPAYHGADVATVEADPEPLPVPAKPAWTPPATSPSPPIQARSRELLFPVNQFGVISVTRLPVQ